MEKSNKKKFQLTAQESLEIERLNYICKIYRSFISILARAYSEAPSEQLKAMIEENQKLYQTTYIELSLAQNELFASLIGAVPPDMRYEFDFDRMEVTCTW